MPTLILSVSGARGLVGDGLDEAVAGRLTRAFLATVGPGHMLIARDSRASGPALARAVAAELVAAGCEVGDLGIVPTPTAQVAVEARAAHGGLVITASHNPPEWNALKFVSSTGRFLDPEQMARLKAHFAGEEETGGVASPADTGGVASPADTVGTSAMTPDGSVAVAEHVTRILETVDVPRIRAAGLKVVVDAVHGAGRPLLEPLLAALGVTVVWMRGEPNGALPTHPEPCAENLGPLSSKVATEDAVLGFAVDPDADRCAFVLPGEPLSEEWTLPLAAWNRLRRGDRGPLVTNLSSSSWMDHLAATCDVPLMRTPVGEAHVTAAMDRSSAVFGGEGNGGVIDPRVHLGRDSGVAVAALLELETSLPAGQSTGGLRAAMQPFPARSMRKRKLPLPEGRLEDLFARLRDAFGTPANEEDGLRWLRDATWIHVRPSGTEPILRAVAEDAGDGTADALLDEVERAAGSLAGS